MIRNAGGRASDALRSLYALDAIGNIGTVVLVHHTGTLSPFSDHLRHNPFPSCTMFYMLLTSLSLRDPMLIIRLLDCGMTHMPDANVRKLLKSRVPDASEEIDQMTFGEIKEYHLLCFKYWQRLLTNVIVLTQVSAKT